MFNLCKLEVQTPPNACVMRCTDTFRTQSMLYIKGKVTLLSQNMLLYVTMATLAVHCLVQLQHNNYQCYKRTILKLGTCKSALRNVIQSKHIAKNKHTAAVYVHNQTPYPDTLGIYYSYAMNLLTPLQLARQSSI